MLRYFCLAFCVGLLAISSAVVHAEIFEVSFDTQYNTNGTIDFGHGFASIQSAWLRFDGMLVGGSGEYTDSSGNRGFTSWGGTWTLSLSDAQVPGGLWDFQATTYGSSATLYTNSSLNSASNYDYLLDGKIDYAVEIFEFWPPYNSLMPTVHVGPQWLFPDGNSTLFVDATAIVPEPSSVVALLCGLVGLIGLKQRGKLRS
ncbi:MAG: PEP-CTERM sorting domain-containing protein [Armatimonadota bacterium]